jgi:hypothetical protein
MVYFDVNPGQDDDLIIVQQGTLISDQVLIAQKSVLGTTNAGNTASAAVADTRIPANPVGRAHLHTPQVGFSAIPVPTISTGAQELPKFFIVGLFGKIYTPATSNPTLI